MAKSNKPLTVGGLTRRISDAIGSIGSVLVQGELTEATIARSGHCYGTLSDGESSIRIVMWRSAVTRQGSVPKEGTDVLVSGSLEVYPPRGSYQLIARSIKPLGAGDLAAQFEQLKAKLSAAGLFDEETKQPLPFLPTAVGLATASGSAAFADMVDSIRERFPGMPIVHAPCLVQGAGASASIASAVARLDKHPDVSVIIVGRGGGSQEDLWAFNEEPVVQAIAACSTPIISAVGHETDTTLADYAADIRAKTPTMAGELVVPVQEELEEQWLALSQELDQCIDDLLREKAERLDRLAQHRALVGPEHQLHLRTQRLDECELRLQQLSSMLMKQGESRLNVLARELQLCSPEKPLRDLAAALPVLEKRLGRSAQHHVQTNEHKLIELAGKMEALSPLKVLGRGYAMMRDKNAEVLRSVESVSFGDQITAHLADGSIETSVVGITPKKRADS